MHAEQEAFLIDILPIIEMGIDSIIHSDAESIIEEYAGGILNYKKIYFFTGRNQNDFSEIWNKYIDKSEYQIYIENFSKKYLETICDIKQQYLKDITGRNIRHKVIFNLPPLEIHISNDMIRYVNGFIVDEKTRIRKEALKDWIAPAAIGLFTGGTGAAIYEIGSIGYDVKITIDDIENQKMDSNDAFIYVCEKDICSQVNITLTSVYANSILQEIENINRRTYSLIKTAL